MNHATSPLVFHRLSDFGRAAASSLARAGYVCVIAIWRCFAVWRERTRQRQALAQLDDRLLRDVGLTRYDAGIEVRKPFWR